MIEVVVDGAPVDIGLRVFFFGLDTGQHITCAHGLQFHFNVGVFHHKAVGKAAGYLRIRIGGIDDQLAAGLCRSARARCRGRTGSRRGRRVAATGHQGQQHA